MPGRAGRDVYVRKGGTVEDTVGRACLCNALTADVRPRPDQAGRLPGGAAGHPRRRPRGSPAADRGAPRRVVRRGCAELAAGGPSALTPSQAWLYRPGHEPRRAPAGRPRHGRGPVPELSPAGAAARRSRRERRGASAARPGGRRSAGQTRHLRHVRGQRPVPAALRAARLRQGAAPGLGVPRAAPAQRPRRGADLPARRCTPTCPRSPATRSTSATSTSCSCRSSAGVDRRRAATAGCATSGCCSTAPCRTPSPTPTSARRTPGSGG